MMSIARNEVQSEITHNTIHKITEDKEVIRKKCCDCGEIKPLTEYNLTITGKRYLPQCKSCQDKLNQPRQQPRIIGRGKRKPIFGGEDYKEKGELYDNFTENFNKLKEMGDTWLRDEILRKHYGDVKPIPENTYKQSGGKCKVCNVGMDKELLHHGLCPTCWTLKKKIEQEERLKMILPIIEKLTSKIGKEWFTAKTLAKYQKKTYEWAYSNLSRMEKHGMVESCYEDRRKYWKVV